MSCLLHNHEIYHVSRSCFPCGHSCVVCKLVGCSNVLLQRKKCDQEAARGWNCLSAGMSASSVFSADAVLQARRGFQSQLSTTLSSAASSFDTSSAALVSAAALFEELLPELAASNGPIRALLGEGSGPTAAMALYQHAIDAVPTEVCP